MKTSTDFAKYISSFLSDYLPHHRNVSTNTIKSYTDTFIQFISFMRDKQNVPIEKLTLDYLNKDNVIRFLQWIRDDRKCSNATRNYRLAAICSFAHYLQYEDIGHLSTWQQILSIKALKTEKRTINYLTIDGIKVLLEQPDASTEKGRRNLALLALMYDTAARVQEIVDLIPDCVRIESRPYTIRLTGKGRKSRIVPLMDEQVDLLRSYMEEHHLFRPENKEHPLFYNSRHEKLTRAGVTFILHTYVKMARILHPEFIPDKVSCHSLRHSKSMHLLQNGVNLVYIRDILGHSSIQTTDIYARADSEQKRKALENAYIDINPKSNCEKLWDKDKTLLEWLQGLR